MTELVSKRSFQEQLVLSFPPEYQGLLGRLNTRFYDDNSSKRIAHEMNGVCWITLAKNLIQEFPISLNNNLYFKPKLLLFPHYLQRNLLSLFLANASLFPTGSLQELDETLDKYKDNMDEWMETLHKLLKVKIKEINNQDFNEKHVVHIDIPTKKSKTRFMKLCKKMKSESIGNDDQQLSWDVLGYKDSTTTTDIIDVECTDLLETRRKDDSKEIIDIMEIDDGIQIVDQQSSVTNEQSSKALLPEPPNDFDMVEITDDDVALNSNVTNVLKEEPDPLTDRNNNDDNTDDNYAGLQSKLKQLQDILHDIASLDSAVILCGNDLQNELQLFNELSNTEMEYACQFLKLNNLPNENIVGMICHGFVKLEPEPSYKNTSIFASYCILPCLTRLESAASRLLGNIIMEFTDKHTNVACDSLFIQLLASKDLNSFQADIICKVIKEKFNSGNRLFQQLLETKINPDGNPFLWSDDIVTVVQTIIDSNAALNKELLETSYIECLEINSKNMAKSLKFTKLILATIKKYSSLISMHKQTFLNILERNETFLKKAGLASLKKIT